MPKAIPSDRNFDYNRELEKLKPQALSSMRAQAGRGTPTAGLGTTQSPSASVDIPAPFSGSNQRAFSEADIDRRAEAAGKSWMNPGLPSRMGRGLPTAAVIQGNPQPSAQKRQIHWGIERRADPQGFQDAMTNAAIRKQKIFEQVGFAGDGPEPDIPGVSGKVTIADQWSDDPQRQLMFHAQASWASPQSMLTGQVYGFDYDRSLGTVAAMRQANELRNKAEAERNARESMKGITDQAGYNAWQDRNFDSTTFRPFVDRDGKAGVFSSQQGLGAGPSKIEGGGMDSGLRFNRNIKKTWVSPAGKQMRLSEGEAEWATELGKRGIDVTGPAFKSVFAKMKQEFVRASKSSPKWNKSWSTNPIINLEQRFGPEAYDEFALAFVEELKG